MSFFNKIELHNNFWMYFSLPIDQLHKYPIWLLLFLQNYIVPFLAFAAISIKIVVKSGRVISRELFGINEFQYCTPSPSQSRDVTAGTTIATAVAPTFSDNLTLFQPGGQILPHQRRGSTKNFPVVTTLQSTRKQINSPPALASPLQNPNITLSLLNSNPIPLNEVAKEKYISLETVVKNTLSPLSLSKSLLLTSQNSPTSPASPLQNPTTPLFPSPSTLNPIPSNEAILQKDKSSESFLKNIPSPSPSETLPPPPPNTPTYKAATHSKKIISTLSPPTSKIIPKSLESVLKNTPSPLSLSKSLLLTPQNSPPSPASPLQNPATPLFPSPSTLKPIPSNEAATQKDKSFERFLKSTPSPCPSETLPLPPPNTPTYQAATATSTTSPGKTTSSRKQINSPPALASPLQNPTTPLSPLNSNPIPLNEVAMEKFMSLEKVLNNTSTPPSPSASLPVPFQNSPPSPASPLQNPATPLFPSPSTLNPIPFNEAATQKDKSLERFLKNTPSPSHSETLPQPPPNTPTYQSATCSKK